MLFKSFVNRNTDNTSSTKIKVEQDPWPSQFPNLVSVMEVFFPETDTFLTNTNKGKRRMFPERTRNNWVSPTEITTLEPG